MKLRHTLLALVVPALMTGVAHAAPLRHHAPVAAARFVNSTTAIGPVIGPWQYWADYSRMPTYRGAIEFDGAVTAACGDEALGCASAGTDGCPPTLTMCAQTIGLPLVSVGRQGGRFTLYHELGHLFDWTYMTDPERHVFLRLMGEPYAPWVENGAQDDFADLYAYCAIGYGSTMWPFNGDGIPTVSSLHKLNEVCALIVHIGHAHRLYDSGLAFATRRLNGKRVRHG